MNWPTSATTWFVRGILILVPIVAGLALFVFFVKQPKDLKKKRVINQTKTVRTIQMKPVSVRPQVTGYGFVSPARTWKAVAEVSGQVSFVHPDLKSGSFLEKGTVIITIDPASYEFSVIEARESIESIDAQIEETEISQKNQIALLSLEEKSYQLSLNELKRQQKLYEKKAISKSILEQEQRSLLDKENKVLSVKNSIKLYPAQLKRLHAQRVQALAKLKEAERKQAATIIRVPYDVRVAQVNIEGSQYVQPGQILAETDGIQSIEVEAQFSVHSLAPLFQGGGVKSLVGAIQNTELPNDLFLNSLSARVLYPIQKESEFRKAKVIRVLNSMDPETKTIGLVIQVDQPYSTMPPLARGAYCEVRIIGKSQKGRLIVPRSALHDTDMIYLVGEQNQLVRRRVEVDYTIKDVAVIKSGIETNAQIIVSDLVPAVDGMILRQVTDENLMASIKETARGETR